MKDLRLVDEVVAAYRAKERVVAESAARYAELKRHDRGPGYAALRDATLEWESIHFGPAQRRLAYALAVLSGSYGADPPPA